MVSRLTFFGYPISHYCVAVDRMLAYKRLSARAVLVSYHDKRELLERTGQDFVPALLSGRRVVRWWEISDFLERLRPSPALYPAGREGLARVLENWGHQVLEERVWRAVVTRAAETFHDPVERWVFEELQTRSRGTFELLRAQEPEYRRELNEYLALVERTLDGHAWLLDEPSAADFGVYGGLSPLFAVGEGLSARYPAVRRWSKAIQNLGPPAFPWPPGPERGKRRRDTPT
ncbi:MAG TPA: glutathione S-transferase family protein [Thermoplasmata archaeon]|nr:glutathione S-transferase family protein [Thermoplasmata archaeon]